MATARRNQKKEKLPAGVVAGEDVTPGQLAKILKVGRSTIQDWFRDGLIEHYEVGPADPSNERIKRRRIPWSQVLELRRRVKKAS